jgi:hypothetical protein
LTIEKSSTTINCPILNKARMSPWCVRAAELGAVVVDVLVAASPSGI